MKTEPTSSHGMRFEIRKRYAGGMVGYEPLFVTGEMIARATEAVVKAHDDEIRAYLGGEVEANAWRPEKYAEAALRAALEFREKERSDA